MKTRFSVEITTGKVTRYLAGKQVSASIENLITARDIMDCEVVITSSGEDVTSSLLDAGRVLTLGLRANTSMGALLAQSSDYALVDGVAQCTLSLNTSEIVALIDSLPAASRSVRVYFEAEISNTDRTWVDTIAQTYFFLQCEVNMEGDEPPAAAAESQKLASESAAAAVAAAQATAADRQAVASDKASVQALKAAADADAQATAADRQAVASDKTAVEELAAAADADAQATAADRQSVASDKAAVQTLKAAADADAQATAADRQAVATDKAAMQTLAASAALTALGTLSGYLSCDTTPELSDALRSGRLYI